MTQISDEIDYSQQLRPISLTQMCRPVTHAAGSIEVSRNCEKLMVFEVDLAAKASRKAATVI
jgi:hypothetical protein